MTSFKTGYYSKLIFFERERERERKSLCAEIFVHILFALIANSSFFSYQAQINTNSIQFDVKNFYTLKSFFHEDKKCG